MSDRTMHLHNVQTPIIATTVLTSSCTALGLGYAWGILGVVFGLFIGATLPALAPLAASVRSTYVAVAAVLSIVAVAVMLGVVGLNAMLAAASTGGMLAEMLPSPVLTAVIALFPATVVSIVGLFLGAIRGSGGTVIVKFGDWSSEKKAG